MSTIANITYNNILYGQCNHWVLLLNKMNQRPINIPIPNAHILTFINVFNDRADYQDHIENNNNNEFTLFLDDENAQQLLLCGYGVPDRLNKITAFCENDLDKNYLQVWIRRRGYLSIDTIILDDDLDSKLLAFGMDFIKDLLRRSRDDHAVYNLLWNHYQALCASHLAYLAQNLQL